MRNRGAFIQKLEARTIAQEGRSVTIGQQSVSAMRSDLSSKQLENIPSSGDNAVFADACAYCFSPTELAAKNIVLQHGTILLDAGLSYTVLSVIPAVQNGGLEIEQPVIAYRTPPPTNTTQSPEQEDMWAQREV